MSSRPERRGRLRRAPQRLRISLPPGTPLDGDATRLGRPATGEHDPLWSRCLFLDDGETVVFLVNIDLYRIARPLRDEILIRTESLAPKESIILTATHTTNGPGGMDDRLLSRWVSGRRNPETLEAVAEAVATSMLEAQAAKRRATIGYGTARQRILSVNALDPNGPIDEQIGVIRVDDADGKAIAIAANFAAAPTLIPAQDQYRFSSGYPGAYYRKMEALADPGCVALFLMGAGGDQRPGNPGNQQGWEQITAIGEELAIGAKAAANDMTFHDATLAVSYREAMPPPSLASANPPEAAILQTLQIDGLLLSFLPGMPSVELGLELRRQAIAGGHRAQFTVGLANGYLGYFVSRSGFAVRRAPGTTQQYGPELEDWLYRQMDALTRQQEPLDVRPRVAEVSRAALAGGEQLVLRGSGFDRGYQRGRAFQSRIQELYDERVVSRIRSGDLRPEGEDWALWPEFFDPVSLAAPALGRAARPMLQGLSRELFAEVEGFAGGAALPFDAAWLLQSAHFLPARPDAPPAVDAPHGTMFGLLGGMADGTVLVALHLDWLRAERPVVTLAEPEAGRHFVQVGADWQIGALAGMNDAGVALCVERNSALGTPGSSAAPISLAVRQLLQDAASLDEALTTLAAASGIRGIPCPGHGAGRRRVAGRGGFLRQADRSAPD